MYSRRVTIRNLSGLHARPASEFVGAAAGFSSRITIKKLSTDQSANAKSIVMLLTLALEQGEEVELSAQGADEREAVDTLVELIQSGMGED